MRLLAAGAVVLALAVLWLSTAAGLGVDDDGAPLPGTGADPPAAAQRSQGAEADLAHEGFSYPRTLEPRAAAAEPARRLVLVVDAAGTPIAGATLTDGAAWYSDGTRRGGDECTTGSDGTALVSTASIWLSACAPGHLLEDAKAPPAEQPWTIRLARSNRIEIALRGVATGGFHAVVRLPSDFRQETFYQEKYVQTPGRVVDGSIGRWMHLPDGTAWHLALSPSGVAVLDQLGYAASATVTLCRFGHRVERREVVLPPAGGCTRLEFTAPPPPPEILGTVVDERGRPLADAEVRLAPCGGMLAIDGELGFPVWAPRARSGADGGFRLPRPDDDGERLVVHHRDHADCVLTVNELLVARGRVTLHAGRVVVLEVVDRNGATMAAHGANWSEYVIPHVHLGRDVWRAPSPQDHPQVAARRLCEPFFVFAELPAGEVRFRFTHLGEETVLDTATAAARYVSGRAVDELQLGK